MKPKSRGGLPPLRNRVQQQDTTDWGVNRITQGFLPVGAELHSVNSEPCHRFLYGEQVMIYITSLDHLDKTIAAVRPARLITLLPEDEPVTTPEGMAPERHLTVAIHDITEEIPGLVAPNQTHVAELISFLEDWRAAVDAKLEEPKLVVHCRMGISRSGAAAFIATCILCGPGREEAIAKRMRELGPHLQPNALIVQIADEILGRDGRMADAIDAMGRGTGYNLSEWVELVPPGGSHPDILT